ncbi:proline--tRNA ligase, partial [Candidatus Woesearchaeota archaeon]|nr:proline--tRNA ligase [Candidatus Woesearchaeota archaeon]
MSKKDEPTQGITVKKDENISEWYTQVIQKAELAEYTGVSGCMVLRPRAFAIWEKLQAFFDGEIKKLGVRNAYFPLLIPESLLKKEAEHVEGFAPEVAWVTMGGHSELNERLAIRPTSETIMYEAYSKWIRSYRDLPLLINQWCNVLRWEFKHPVPFLRGREFLWQEGHTVHADKKGAEKEVLVILELYKRVFEDLLAVPVIKGRKSDNEKFAGADYSTSVETFAPSGKAVQAATSHHLGQRFAKSFNISFLNEKGESCLPYQNSWGFSTRSIGAMVLYHGDDNGLVIPPKVAPLHVVFVPIMFEDSKEKVVSKCHEVAKHLEKTGVSVFVDDRDGYTPGWKFN